MNLYLHICPCTRALGIWKNIGILVYFGLVTAEIMGGFRHFAFCSLGNRLASFFVVPKNCIFWGASFELMKNLATLFPKKLQGFHGTLLYHCYTLSTAETHTHGGAVIRKLESAFIPKLFLRCPWFFHGTAFLFPSNSHISATFLFWIHSGKFWNLGISNKLWDIQCWRKKSQMDFFAPFRTVLGVAKGFFGNV